MIVGLTGGFGTGKSTVAGMFKSLGAGVIDADKISHNFLKPRNKVYKKIVLLLGKGILGTGGVIDRRKLAAIVFGDKKALFKFNKIMHPAIISRIKQQIKKAREEVVVLDAPLLFEAKLDRLADIVVVVKAGRDKQFSRLKKRVSLSKAEIIARIRSQIPLREKLRLADFVIDNNGTLQNTRKQVALIKVLKH